MMLRLQKLLATAKTHVLALVVCGFMGTAFVGGSLQAADFDFRVDPNADWVGFVNAIPVGGTDPIFGFGTPNASTMSANFAAGPALPLTIGPNTRIYDEESDPINPEWINPITLEPLRYIEANYYQETGFGTVAVDDTWSIQGYVTSSDLGTSPWSTGPEGWNGVAFLKVLDPDGDWATTQNITAPLVPGQSFSLEGTVEAVPSGGAPFIQAGFALTGPIISASDPLAGTGINIVPEPTTAALMGLCSAAAVLILRRRNHR